MIFFEIVPFPPPGLPRIRRVFRDGIERLNIVLKFLLRLIGFWVLRMGKKEEDFTIITVLKLVELWWREIRTGRINPKSKNPGTMNSMPT